MSISLEFYATFATGALVIGSEILC